MPLQPKEKLLSLAPFSGLLLQLYRSARELPAPHYQDAALHLLRTVVPFDSTMWCTGTFDGSRVTVHSMHLYEQTAELVEGWEAVSHEDVVAQVVVRHPGVTVNAHAPTLLPAGSALRELTSRFGIENCLATAGALPESPLFNWFSLFRADEEAQFSEFERALCQALFPHVLEALTLNRLLHLDAMYTNRQAARSAVAIVDRKGSIYNSDGGFESCLRTEWPDWNARVLPKPLIVLVTSQRVGDLFFLKARSLGPVDRLTRREKEIAERFAQGLSHKEIAKLLDIAPATVRNYIQTIYGKLGVSDKAALASLMVKSE